MRKFFTLASVLFSCIAAAKTTGITIPTMYPHFGSSQPANNMGGVPIRLISKVKTLYDGNVYRPFDSSTYSYSNGRGGILDLDYDDKFLNYDNSIFYEYDESQQSYKNVRRYSQTFNSANNIEHFIQENWINDQIQWHNGVMYEYLYSSDLSRLEQTGFYIWNGSWTGNSMDYILTYDGNNDVVEIQFTTNVTELAYDANHNVTERKEYSFTSGLGWHYSDKYSFSYDASDNLTSYTLQKFNNGSWDNSLKKDFVYANGILTHTVEFSWQNSTWQAARQNLFSYDAMGNKLSDEYQVWDDASQNFVNTRKEEWNYNAQNQPLTYKSLTWNTANQSWQPIKNDFLYRYQYEYYYPTAIDKIPAASEVFTLYPQPASNVLNVSFKSSSGATYHGYIYDARGSVVKSFEVNSDNNSIPLSDIPSGNYLVGLDYKGKKIAQPLIVTR